MNPRPFLEISALRRSREYRRQGIRTAVRRDPKIELLSKSAAQMIGDPAVAIECVQGDIRNVTVCFNKSSDRIAPVIYPAEGPIEPRRSSLGSHRHQNARVLGL